MWLQMLRSHCTVYFDRPGRRLVYAGIPADEGYWDGHWASRISAADIRNPDRFVTTVTKRFLPNGARVVDVGCGIARTVYGLQGAGFDAVGIDYAPETVAVIKRLAPELNVLVGDARELPFADASFDGVWSLGVVEHFYNGFEQIASETCRVLKSGGYAFVTVPSMSPLRRIKAKLGAYPSLTLEPDDFYQFALPSEAVIEGFRPLKLVESTNRGGFKGLKDEVSLLQPFMQRLYDSKFGPLRPMRAALDRVLAPLCYHTRLYVFRK
jgi:SAM-dependent methyltransferase